MRKLSDYQYIKTWIEGDIGRIELNRPEVLNALNRKMVSEITDSLERYDQSEQVKVIVISGAGKVFAAGADINEMANDRPIELEKMNQFKDWDRIHHIKKPIISAVQGFALGGGFELLLSSDVIFVAENTKLGFPEVNLGVMPSAGGTVKLTKAIGTRRALEWLWTGEYMDVEQAYNYGLINRIVPPELLLEESIAFAKKISSQAPIALKLIKEVVYKSEDLPLYESMLLERKNFYLLFDTVDQKEGMDAFKEKRKPTFKGM